MNFAEGYALESELKNHGWEQADSPEGADAVVLHTCSVRQTAENRIWGRLGFFKHIKQSRSQKLIVMGCMAERLKDELQKREPAVDLVVGNYSKEHLVEILQQVTEEQDGERVNGRIITGDETAFHFQQLHHREHEYHAYVPIMHGCNNFCTYCIVPYVRGREVSRAPGDIIEEIAMLESRGVKEISLLGQNVNSYNYSNGSLHMDFPDILQEVLQNTHSIEWVRFITSHPKDVPPRLIELIGAEKKLCNHIHLPVQHGSSSVLERMNRKYSREDYLRLVEKMRATIGEISITTDILIGFPGETEFDFKTTIELLEEVRFDDAFMYYYNVREGTPAARFEGQLPQQLKLDRLSEVIDTQRRISLEKRRERVGTVETVLAESVSKKNSSELLGRTERDQMVVFPGTPDQIGTFLNVRLDQLHGNTFKGSIDRQV